MRSYQLEPRVKHLGILVDAHFKMERYRQVDEFCRQELRRRTWRGCLAEPRIAIKLLRALWASRRGRRKKEREERRGQEERERREQAERARLDAQKLAAAAEPPRPRRRPHLAAPPWPSASPPELPIDLQASSAPLADELASLGADQLAQRVPHLELPAVYLKHDELRDQFERQFQPISLRVRFLGVRESVTEYLGVGLTYAPRGGESREAEEEDVQEVWLSLADGALLEFPDYALADAVQGSGESFRALTGRELVERLEVVLRKARPRVVERLRGHLHACVLELEREFARLDTHHRTQWEEESAAIAADANRRELNGQPPAGAPLAGSHAETAAERAFDEALRRQRHEFERAARELTARHAVRARLDAVDVRRLRLPVMLAQLEITRRQTSRRLVIPYNPLLRGFEPLACTRCDRDDHAFGATDAGEVICSACASH